MKKILFLAALAYAQFAHADAILNDQFTTPTAGLSGPNYATNDIGQNTQASSSAASWKMYNNSAVTTTSQLLPTTDPAGATYMLNISTPGTGNGIFQGFANSYHVTETADIYLTSGSVYLELYTSGGVLVSKTLDNTSNTWVNVSVSGASGNEFVLYSATGAGATFDVDNASVAVPDTATTIGMLALGFVCLAFAAKNQGLSRIRA